MRQRLLLFSVVLGVATALMLFLEPRNAVWATPGQNPLQQTVPATPTPTPTPTPILAPVKFVPANVDAIAGTPFNLEIWTNAPPSQVISGVEIHIDFDPSFLEVLDTGPNNSLVDIQPDTAALSSVLINSATAGHIMYGAGKLQAPFPTGSFRVATITFKPKIATLVAVPTLVKFAFSPSTGMVTKVSVAGGLIPGAPQDATVGIQQATLTGFVTLQGGERPLAGWQVPVTVKFFVPGANVITSTPVATLTGVTTRIGTGPNFKAQFSVTPIPVGIFDITVKSPHTLINVKQNVTVAVPGISLELETLLEGDANDDNIVNIFDFTILSAAFLKPPAPTGPYSQPTSGVYNAAADFDRNGIVDILDFTRLADNFLKASPIVVP